MSDMDHLLIPYAGASADGCRAAAAGLELPRLARLLARLGPAGSDLGEEDSLSPPHERALARAHGLEAPDGELPLAALAAWQAGDQPGEQPCGWITPCHWRVGTDRIVLYDPAELALEAEESQALLAAMAPFFEEDGLPLRYLAPTRWLARGEPLRGLATASLDRVVGHNIQALAPQAATSRVLHRLQNEMQMLLYTHRVNDVRQARGLLPVNSFWVSGTGVLATPPAPGLTPPQQPHALRDAALRHDWAAWAEAWRALDAGPCAALLAAAEAGRPVRLTLCGERNALTFDSAGRPGLARRLLNLFGPKPVSDILLTL